ncbi:hypothetical protein GQ44DRAFT_744615 [Phaeosphaeriaceae sp. PMI808]|nr:hypothetical protein GQ44DRAFT_744615 [Phaeosphaeriaceae sp. PMI808]
MPSTLLADSNILVVDKIVVAGHAPTPSTLGGEVYVNRWVIYLQLEQGGSIRLDMSPAVEAGVYATLIVKRLDYNTSVDVTLECRCWVYTVMNDLQKAGFVGGTGAESFAVVSLSWTTGGMQIGSTPEWTEGTFG